MLVHLVAALLQVTAPPSPAPQTAAPAAARAAPAKADTSAAERRRRRREARETRAPKRDSVTAEHLATAYHSSAARELLLLARAARMHQDSALQSYDATTYQRISAGLGLSKIGRDRLAFRSETATHVRWRRGVGAYVEVTGSRAVVPIAGKSAHVELGGDVSPVPYYPGSETLWIGESARASVDENQGLVHPLAEGAEAYYTYESGDSVSFTLPGGKVVRLRELKVRPRSPKWNLAVGSLWFDLSGGQLVRAAYRMAVPMDMGEVARADDSTSFDDVPVWVKPMIFPMTAQISGIGIEYGLFEGRFWLPRLQILKGEASMGIMHSPIEMQQRYEYSQVNGGGTLPPIARPDTTRRDSGGVNIVVGDDSSLKSKREIRRAARKVECEATGSHSYTRRTRDTLNLVRISISCDSLKLASSPDLPPSIYDKGDELFSASETDALMAQALSMGAQADFAPQLPTVDALMPRYNRVEGLSFGARADQQLGDGFSAHATARIGVADREPNIQLTGSRSDMHRTRSFTAYNRLNSASEWGNVFGLGSSLRSFVFGNDEGFYYRATGLELTSAPDDATGSSMTWGLFVEQERSARQRTTFSLARAVNGVQFGPNIEAVRGTYAGARTQLIGSFGADPQGFRLFTDTRLEAAHGDTGSYGRAAMDVTASRGVGDGAAALTVGAGSSVGVLPMQRAWFLGGAQTVRGQAPGTEIGSAYWLARAELAQGTGVVRPVLFGDMGWAGDRTAWRQIGQPMSGAGIGATIADGLVRIDLSRGINPITSRGWRLDSYVEARF
jgi:hypothetical protein